MAGAFLVMVHPEPGRVWGLAERSLGIAHSCLCGGVPDTEHSMDGGLCYFERDFCGSKP